MASPHQALRGLVLVLTALAATATAQPVDFRPVVLTGADVPELLGANVTAPVCYAYRDGAWQQCPLQIDERELLDPASNYPRTVSDAAQLFGGERQLLYTAPQDYPMPGFDPVIRVDSRRAFDADDELVLMARFFGDVVSPAAPPFAPATVSEVLFEGKAAYLFVPTQPLDQSAGIDLVSYTFDLVAGNFPQAYTFEDDTTLPDAWAEGDYLAANPESSPASTAYYSTLFEDRWIQRELRLGDGSGGYGPDLLDRVKYGTRPNTLGNNGVCGRTIWSGSARRGTLGIQKDGPLRALRFAQGYNSGGLNYVLYHMYERFIVYRMAHQMHRSPGASMWFDLAPEASGMTYTSNLFPDGVPVDGQPELAPGNAFLDGYVDWDYLIGDQGTMVSTWEIETNINGLYPYSYYEDSTTPETQQCTGDTQAFASAGNVYLTGTPDDGSVPWTDPTSSLSYDQGELRFLRLERSIVPEVPNLPEADAQATVAQLSTPITFTVTPVDVMTSGDVQAPLVEGSYSGSTFLGTASDDRPNDTGLATLALSASATNLAFTADPFIAGDAAAGFTVTPVDAEVTGTGYVVATDVAGNADSLLVTFEVVLPDTAPPVLTGTYGRSRFDGTATEDRANDTGVASVVLGAAASNLVLSLDAFTGSGAVVSFTATPENAGTVGMGYVVATDAAGNADSLFVEIVPPPQDEAAPVVGGALSTPTTFAGTADDSGSSDTGIASIVLSTDAVNLVLSVDSFLAGAPVVAFTAGSIVPAEAASGYVVATDVAGNADSVFVSLDAVAVPFDLAASAAYAYTASTTGTITVTASNIGTDPLTSVRVVRTSASGLTISQKSITLGAVAPGASKDAVFSFSNATAGARASFQVQDLVVREGEGDVSNNDIAVTLDPAGDLTPPTLAGSAAGTTWTGTATDSGLGATGLATVTLGPDATNLTLSVDAFTPGDAQVTLSVALTDDTQPGSGTVIATDLAGNTGSLALALQPAGADTEAPILTGSYTSSAFEGTASDDRPGDTGLASITLRDAVNLRLSVLGDLPGASVVSFRVQPTNRRPGEGTVVAVDVAGNESTLFIATSLAGRRGTDEAPRTEAVLDAEAASKAAVTDEAPGSTADATPRSDAARPPGNPATDERTREALRDAEPALGGAADERAASPLAEDTGASSVAETTKRDTAVTDEAAGSPPWTPTEPAEASPSIGAGPPASTAVEPASPFMVEVYPNPHRGAATLRLYLATESPVRVALYDLTGRRVVTVVDRRLGPGWHALRLDTQELARGIYLWRTETALGVETGRLSVAH
ncbi:MAG: T9SS type A sorting domain-containing protein [Bacteroidota bacterium]